MTGGQAQTIAMAEKMLGANQSWHLFSLLTGCLECHHLASGLWSQTNGVSWRENARHAFIVSNAACAGYCCPICSTLAVQLWPLPLVDVCIVIAMVVMAMVAMRSVIAISPGVVFAMRFLVARTQHCTWMAQSVVIRLMHTCIVIFNEIVSQGFYWVFVSDQSRYCMCLHYVFIEVLCRCVMVIGFKGYM